MISPSRNTMSWLDPGSLSAFSKSIPTVYVVLISSNAVEIESFDVFAILMALSWRSFSSSFSSRMRRAPFTYAYDVTPPAFLIISESRSVL